MNLCFSIPTMRYSWTVLYRWKASKYICWPLTRARLRYPSQRHPWRTSYSLGTRTSKIPANTTVSVAIRPTIRKTAHCGARDRGFTCVATPACSKRWAACRSSDMLTMNPCPQPGLLGRLSRPFPYRYPSKIAEYMLPAQLDNGAIKR